MTEDRLPLNELLQKAGDGDFLRAVAESVPQLLMEADVEGLIGAGRHERAADRLNWRNGYARHAAWLAQSQDSETAGRQLLPAALEARKTTEKALVAVIQEAWIGGVSTRRVDEIAQAIETVQGNRRARRSHGAQRRLADAELLHADRGLRRAGRQARRPQAVADYTQGGLTNEPLSYTRKLHHIDGRDPKPRRSMRPEYIP